MSVISDRLCFICLIWHTRGDKPVLPWLSRKNSGLLVRIKGPLGYSRTLIAYAGSGPPRHSTSTYDGPGGVFTIAILKNHDQPFYNVKKSPSFRRFIVSNDVLINVFVHLLFRSQTC